MANENGLPPPPPPKERGMAPVSQAMTGSSFWGGQADEGTGSEQANAGFGEGEDGGQSASRAPATETIGRRAGSLSDELDFPEFVASLIHGTWDAMVDSSIRQMDAFADLVSAISKPVEQFRDENISVNQARDWLVAQHPGDLELAPHADGYSLVPRGGGDEFGDSGSPDWLSEFDLAGQSLSTDLIEEQLIPLARDRMARDRMHSLATLVMLGLNRIKVDDGSITARLRFRASAADRTGVDYAVSDDPGSATPSANWSTRGSTSYAAPVTKVSTVGVNAQTDSTLNAELFGQVKINFSSETLPLDRFVDDAQRVILERAARPAIAQAARTVDAAAQPQAALAQPVQQPQQTAPVQVPSTPDPRTATAPQPVASNGGQA